MQQGKVVKVHVFLDLGYGMLLTTSKEKFKAMILIAVLDYADCI